MTAEVVDWDVGPLLVIAVVYTFLACWSFGAALPTGLFIPCFMIGGAMGYTPTYAHVHAHHIPITDGCIAG
jgi:H+/Cl- antiporter ClcA